MHESPDRLIVVSNRLPVALRQEQGEWKVKPGAGGLVTALAPVLQHRGGMWIGWSGAYADVDLNKLFGDYAREVGYSLKPVHLTKEEVDGYYYGFSNEIIWPLFHQFQTRCNFNPDYWRHYLEVNMKFAEAIAAASEPEDYIWVHDYHLMHAAFLLKSMGLKRKTGFFLHIPFPPPEIFLKLPWREKLLRALLEFDLVGLQTLEDRRNFVQCMQRLLPKARVSGRGSVVHAEWEGRTVRLGGFPISIDYNAFANLAAKKEVAARSFELKQACKNRKLILGVDRLDYSKGIPERIKAVGAALRRYPDLRGKINFIQVVVPSREEVAEYQELKIEIEQLVSRLNGEFTMPGWVPVHYMYRSLPREELVAYYRSADMALVTPLCDGLNLVAKEYCAANVDETGVLILSEFAGAAAQLQRHGALLVNPFDSEGVARTIRRAYRATEADRRTRMRKMRDAVRRHNIYWWVDSFLMAAFSMNLNDFPPLESVDFHEK
ncbi:MAG: alpha,alpha-trehalose-phosphate synthase (UDP-forming) [Desulfovibrionaceae bacterium]